MYWHGRLVIPTFQRFCSSQQVARRRNVSISSPSSKGGGNINKVIQGKCKNKFPLVLLQAKVVGYSFVETEIAGFKFPLVLLQAKVVGARFLNHDTARLSDPQIYAPL